MLLEILSMAMINPTLDKVETLDKIAYENKHIKTVEVVNDNYSGEYSIPYKRVNFDSFYSSHKSEMAKVISDFNSRKLKDEQYLKWANLPQEQLKGHLNEIYSQANKLKMRKDKVNRPLVVLGIGGSKHTAEFLLNMTGFNDKDVYFYYDIY